MVFFSELSELDECSHCFRLLPGKVPTLKFEGCFQCNIFPPFGITRYSLKECQ